MEKRRKKITGGIKIGGRIIRDRGYYWAFTEDEIEEYLRILDPIVKRADIFNFLSAMSYHLDNYMRLESKDTHKIRAQKRKNLNHFISQVQALRSSLESIQNGEQTFFFPIALKEQIFADIPITVDNKRGAESSEYHYNNQVQGASKNLIHEIDKYLLNLHSIEEATTDQKRGRKAADSVGLIKIVASYYSRHIGKPSSTESGPFEAVVKLTHEILRLPCEDPSRGIKAALKKQINRN